MNIEELREYCISKAHVEEAFPFDEETLVFKAGGKIFLLVDINGNPVSFNVKCDPERAVELREQHSFILPGYHMNKKLWNTVYMNGSLSNSQLHQMIDHSYNLIFNSLPQKIKDQILKNGL